MFQGPPLGSVSYSGHSAHLLEFCPPICGPIRLRVPGGKDEVWLTTISPAPSTVAGLGQRQCALDERGEGRGGGHGVAAMRTHPADLQARGAQVIRAL